MLQSVLRLLRMAPIIYPDAARVWLFPSDAPSGHREEHKAGRETDLSHWGNDLRQSYRTLGQVAGVSDLDMHLLMNHSLPGMSAGYFTRSELMGDHPRQQQEKISKLVVGRGRRPGALRKLEIQAARCAAQNLAPGHLDAPSRRLKSGKAA